jgi:uncharacterized protein GlcG (DUF336 family)
MIARASAFFVEAPVIALAQAFKKSRAVMLFARNSRETLKHQQAKSPPALASISLLVPSLICLLTDDEVAKKSV